MSSYLKNPLSPLLMFTLFTTPAFAFEYGNPTPDEQAHLESINRARQNPLLEAQRLHIDLFEGVPTGALGNGGAVQPLSSNALLLNIARAHTADMLKNNYFAHNDLAGATPFDRMQAAQYYFQVPGENIGWQGSSAALDNSATALTLHDTLFIDKGVTDRGHRTNILDPNFREVGVGLGFGPYKQNGVTYNAGMVTTDFGVRTSSKPIILGVVYDDKNADQFYTAGEGLEAVGVAVSASNATQSAAAGGYGLEVEPNQDYTLTFTHPINGKITKTVHVDNLNVKVDILASAFPNVALNTAQCATLEQNTLTIPCITVAGNTASAVLKVSNNNPLQFSLQSSANSTQKATAQCGTYDIQTTTAHLNCVAVGKARYWADLKFNGSVFALGAYGAAQ